MTFSDRTISSETVSLWEGVTSDGFEVPTDRSLSDMTAELTSMLADPDPHVRDELALPILTTWIGRGEYDDLLAGLGDGMATGLTVGLGGTDENGVFRRSFSALVLAACIDRDSASPSVPDTQILIWGDRLVSWLLGERDVRGFVPGKGWAHTVAHGADAIGSLGASPRLGPQEQQVMLHVIAERLSTPTDALLTAGEPDRCAAAVLRILRRGDLTADDLEAWITDLTQSGTRDGHADPAGTEQVTAANVQFFLRALYIHVSFGTPAPSVRTDLLLLLAEALRISNRQHLDRSE